MRLCCLVLVILFGAPSIHSQTTDWKAVHDEGVARLRAWMLPEAKETLSRAVAKAREFEAPDARLAESLVRLAETQEMLRDRDAAEKSLDEAVTVLESARGRESVELIAPLTTLARLRRFANDFEAAVEIMHRVLTIADAAREEGDPEPLETIVPLARDLRSLGRVAEAVPLFERGLKEMERRLEPLHPDLTRPITDLAHVYRLVERFDEAAALHRRWIEIYEKAKGEDHPSIAAGLENLATVLMEQGKCEEAEAVYRRWMKIVISISSEENANVAAILGRIARAVAGQGKHVEAAKLFGETLAMYEKHIGKQHRVMVPLLLRLSELEVTLKRNDAAVASARRALAILDDPNRSEPIRVDGAMMVLGRALAAAGSWKEANETARAVVARREARGGKEHPSLVEPLELMARTLGMLGNTEAAAAASARAAAIQRAGVHGESDPSK